MTPMRSAPRCARPISTARAAISPSAEPAPDPGHLCPRGGAEGDVLTNRIIGVALEDHQDAYAAECGM
jgi:hypothetical protein